MQSSSGTYRPGLDQLRAVAVFLVFCWHFMHTDAILPLREGHAAPGPLSIVSMGYVGVSLFMVLSGYLFAGITDGVRIDWTRFMRNRALRLLPMLGVALMGAYLKSRMTGQDLQMGERLLWGWLLPSLPQGGWSITVELHFYVLLPVLLLIGRRSPYAWLGVMLAAVALRWGLLQRGEDMEYLSYYTLVGRIDQFMMGMLAWHARRHVTGRHGLWLGAAALYAWAMHELDSMGSPLGPHFNRPELWVVLPTMDAVFFGLTVAWFDTSFTSQPSRLGRAVAAVGRSSYSLYLLHTFWVFSLARWIDQHVVSLGDPLVTAGAACVAFLVSAPVAALSYRLIEKPFLAARRAYRLGAAPNAACHQPDAAVMEEARKVA
ncbi:MAG TPA: acyltransferase [Aquabacterium sp.]|uniref:acyltransferase family protein n=1 Tax=Aquabacterium sp. TaxID=1872578 RepID=UPI002E2EB006|nr:acyltransferase [Aquabacterium sp.]HEX5354798.1 acyltransferase [Aquabacterium sp.]